MCERRAYAHVELATVDPNDFDDALPLSNNVQLPDPKNAAYRVLRSIFLACLSSVAVSQSRRVSFRDIKVRRRLSARFTVSL